MADNYALLEEAMKRRSLNQDSAMATLQEQQKSFTDKLRERREYQQKVLGVGAERYAGGLNSSGPQADPQALGRIYNSLLASSVEQLAPYEKDVKDTTDALTKASTDNTEVKNLMDLIGLKQTDAQQSLTATEKGYAIDPTTGKVTIANGALANPVQEVLAQGGNDILKSVPVSNRDEMAKMILKTYGSVDNYRKNADLKDLFALNPDLQKADTSAQNILAGLAPIEGMFPEGTKSDLGIRSKTGSVVGKTWEPLKTKDQKDAASFISQYATAQIKEISGVAVSPAEMDRMRGYIPDKNDDEAMIAQKVQNIKKAVQMNMAIRELAAREGLTLTQAETKYKPQLMKQFGVDSAGASPTPGPTPLLDSTDEDLIKKYKGK